jgi:hypothetical protein
MPSRGKLARLVGVAGAAVIVLFAFAALQGGGGGSAHAAVARAATRTLDAGSSRFSITTAFDATNESTTVDGVMDYRRHIGEMNYLRTVKVVFIGDATFFRFPLPGLEKKPWVRVDDDTPDPTDIEERVLRDPARLLAFLRGVSDEVSETGREEVRGVSTTRYDGTIDLERVVERAAAGELEREELRSELDLLRELGIEDTVRFAAWIDGDGVARRVRLASGGRPTTVVEFYDFGVEVAVSQPPTDQIATQDEYDAAVDALSEASASACKERQTEHTPPPNESTTNMSICVLRSQDTGVSEISTGRTP